MTFSKHKARGRFEFKNLNFRFVWDLGFGIWDFAKTLILSLCFLFFVLLFSVHAEPQFTIGSIIRGFEMPQMNAEGKLQTKITGDEALVVSDNQIRIKNLAIEVYDEQENPTTTIVSNECVYWKLENKLTAEKNIKVQRPGMIITAQAMEWSMGDSKGAFRDNVKVIVQPGVYNFKP